MLLQFGSDVARRCPPWISPLTAGNGIKFRD
jgi:hypothetical protein